MESIREIIREKTIELDTLDPVTRGGFTQVPNFILKRPDLSIGAKLTYAMFLSYAWHNDSCFPGQGRLAKDIGLSRSRVTEFISELSRADLVSVHRRGLGKTNIYRVHFTVNLKASRKGISNPRMSVYRHPEVDRAATGGQSADIPHLKNTKINNTQ